MKNTEFSMNESEFKSKYLPVYNQFGAKPKTLVQFSVVLPFEVPFVEGMCHTVVLQDNSAISLRFSDIEANEGYKYGIMEANKVLKSYHSKVEMTFISTILYDDIVKEKEKYLNEYFDELLKHLNLLIMSYQISKKDTDAYYLTKEMMANSVFARLIPVDNWSKEEYTLFLLHTNVPYKKNKLDGKDQEEIIRHSEIILSGINPFVLSEFFSLNAKRFFKNGFYQEAIIYAQTGIETFLNALFTELLIAEGIAETEISMKLEETPFMSIVKKEISKRLGGSWDITRNETDVGKWYQNTYLLRNKVVHGGYRPSYDETNKAIYWAIEFRQHIIKLIEAKKNEYPKLFSYFLIRKANK